MTYSHLLQSIYYFFCYFFLCYGCSEQKTESIYFFPAHDGKKAGPIPFSEGQSHINRNHPRPRISSRGLPGARISSRGLPFFLGDHQGARKGSSSLPAFLGDHQARGKDQQGRKCYPFKTDNRGGNAGGKGYSFLLFRESFQGLSFFLPHCESILSRQQQHQGPGFTGQYIRPRQRNREKPSYNCTLNTIEGAGNTFTRPGIEGKFIFSKGGS